MALDVDALKGRATRLLKNFAPAQLVIIGLLSVVGVIGAVFFLRWVSTPSYGVLLAGLDAKDAAAVTTKLQADGVAYKLASGGTTVMVPQADMDKERIAVAAAGLPASSTSDGWAAFDKQGLTSSSFQQQVAYQRALEATLAGSLEQIDGVRSAQVHLALPEKRLFSEDQQPARASVLVQTNGTLSDSTVDSMTHLVASAVPALEPKDVSITDGSGTLLTGDSTAGGTKAEAARRTYEDALTNQVSSMFDTLLGPGHAVVRVNAEMDTSNTTIDSQVYDPKRSAVLSETKSSETYAPGTTATTTSGPLTTAPATGVTGASSTATTKDNGYSKTDSSTTNGVSVTTSHQVVAPGGVKRLTVAVAVDSNAKNAPSSADISSMVSAAVGLDPKRGDTISVTTPSFLMTSSSKKTGSGSSQPALADKVTSHAPQTLGAVLLLLVGLGFLRTVKRGVSTELSAEQVTAAVEARRREALAGRPAAALPPGSIPAPRSDADDIIGALDDNPDEVAGLLRGWLANVGPGDR